MIFKLHYVFRLPRCLMLFLHNDTTAALPFPYNVFCPHRSMVIAGRKRYLVTSKNVVAVRSQRIVAAKGREFATKLIKISSNMWQHCTWFQHANCNNQMWLKSHQSYKKLLHLRFCQIVTISTKQTFQTLINAKCLKIYCTTILKLMI